MKEKYAVGWNGIRWPVYRAALALAEYEDGERRLVWLLDLGTDGVAGSNRRPERWRYYSIRPLSSYGFGKELSPVDNDRTDGRYYDAHVIDAWDNVRSIRNLEILEVRKEYVFGEPGPRECGCPRPRGYKQTENQE